MTVVQSQPAAWRCGRFLFDLQTGFRPLVMGVLNCTPDSFSDGGKFFNTETAIERAHQMIAEGAQIIDIGGESTRPGAVAISSAQEQDRVLPVIEALQGCAVALSLDSYQASTMRAALKVGIDLLNDISGFVDQEHLQIAQENEAVGLCVMHMQENPLTMQLRPSYQDVVMEVNNFFKQRLAVLKSHAIASERVVLDPGIGFGKTPTHNLMLINRLADLLVHGQPLLLGISRKSTLGLILGSNQADRTMASVAAAMTAIEHGARIVRVHDVGPTVEAIQVWSAIKTERVDGYLY